MRRPDGHRLLAAHSATDDIRLTWDTLKGSGIYFSNSGMNRACAYILCRGPEEYVPAVGFESMYVGLGLERSSSEATRLRVPGGRMRDAGSI